MKLTPKQVYDKLVVDDKVLEKNGKITFQFSDVSIIVRQRDVVGNILQEWLEGWLKNKGIPFALNDNTQMPPDFFLDPDNLKKNLLEVKAFNNDVSPAFDIADFRMYEEEITNKPWMLDVDYLIFGYNMSATGVVTVKRIWLKKVWEICSASKDWPLKLQVKKGVVYKLRPCSWFSKKPQFKVFDSLSDFLSAVDQTVYQNPATKSMSGTWSPKFRASYKDYYKKEISIPRWYDISKKYGQ